jgi:hypothetical protein
VRLYAHANGRLSFADKDPAGERIALGRLVARRRAARDRLKTEQRDAESLHLRHMARLGVIDDPTRSRSHGETHLHFVRHDSEEEALWLAWQEHLSA